MVVYDQCTLNASPYCCLWSLYSKIRHLGSLWSVYSIIRDLGSLWSVYSIIRHLGSLWSVYSIIRHIGCLPPVLNEMLQSKKTPIERQYMDIKSNIAQ